MLPLARARAANVPIDARAALRAGLGYSSPLPDGVESADDVVRFFLTPQPPKGSAKRIEALNRELRALDAHAFDIHEKRQMLEKELAKEAQQRKVSRERVATRATEEAAVRSKILGDKGVASRAREEAIRAFAEGMRDRASVTIP